MGCAAPTGSGSDDGAVTTSESALDEAGTITFGADFKVQTIGILQRTKKVRIAYDASRLPTCRGDFMGNPGWSVGGFWRMGDAGEVHAFEVAGFSPTGGHGDGPVLTLAQAGELQVWFQNTSRWGCSAFDSDFGKNYRFAVKPAAADPGWMGNVSSVTSRATCDGKACDADVRPITGDVLYDTYTRQRTAIREVLFEVWKEGVTDFDNAELWKQLDVQVHSRLGGAGPFATTAYVPFDRRQGNNARYGVDLRGLDPILGLGTVTKKSDCPAVTLTVDPTGTYVEAVVELYFTVNGAELRPSSGGGYRVRYQNYKQPYAICL
ncbi:MAG: hypothetical protein JWP97_5511 [Labilithrix sp.]|nr:hypothetical protein [Labilithrix sp.]